jgi:hypothetical protein
VAAAFPERAAELPASRSLSVVPMPMGCLRRAGRHGRTVAAMDETDPIARAQHQLRDNLELVQRYGQDEAADYFGGCYWDNEPPITIVALFTAEVDRYQTVLRGRLTHPDRLVIRAARQMWRQVQADNRQVADTLMPRTDLGVHGVGISLHEERFIICVHIEPYTVELAARIAALVAPREVLVQQGGPYRIP